MKRPNAFRFVWPLIAAELRASCSTQAHAYLKTVGQGCANLFQGS